MKLRAQQLEPPERKLRLRINGRLAADLDEYRALYARTHGSEIEMAALVEGILVQFLETDRAFQRERAANRVGLPANGRRERATA
jgi:hypothetical protein